MRQPTVLLVDDCPTVRDTFSVILRGHHRVLAAPSAEEGLALLDKNNVDVVFLDLGLPGMGGLEALPLIRDRYEDVDVVIITVQRELRTVVQAMKLGAYDYIDKDSLNPDEILSLLDRINEKRQMEMELRYRRSEMSDQEDVDLVLGTSQAMRDVYETARKVAGLPTTILITGESGTGKEVLAQAIHRMGGRTGTPLVKVDLVSIHHELMESTLFGHEKGAFTGASQLRHGKFELANGGTVFLDEIGDMGYEAQGKLLRVIQDGVFERVGGSRMIRTEARVIAATRRDLEVAVREGRFRDDLYFRLNVVRFRLPPLRERSEDVEPLAHAFVAKYSRKFGKRIEGIEPEALEALRAYPWPGNIRELENLIARCLAVKSEGAIDLGDLPVEFHIESPQFKKKLLEEGDGLAHACEVFEREFILKSLEKFHYSRKDTAEHLRIPLSTFKYKLDRLGIYEVLHEKPEKPVSKKK